MTQFDERTHPYALQVVDFPQGFGNSKLLRQATQDRKERGAAGGDNERGLGYLPKGLNAGVAKPTKQQFEQWKTEEPGLLRRLQNGDERAAELLAKRYRWWLQVRVGRAVRKVSGGLFFGDVFSCALIRFLECLRTFRPGSNNGLRAYLEKAINGAISDAQQEWQSKGFSGFDTRLRRFLHKEGNRHLELEEIQKLFPSYTLGQIAEAMEPIVQQNYSEGAVDDGNGHQDDDEHNAPSGYALTLASNDPVNAQRSAASQWSKRAALGYRWPKEHAQRNVFAYEKKHNKRVYGSPWIDHVERYYAHRDEALLKLLGRQGYADHLINRKSTCPPPENEAPAPYVAAAPRYRHAGWGASSLARVIEAEKKAKRYPATTNARNAAAVVVLNSHRSNSLSDLVTAVTTDHQIRGIEYGPANALRRNVSCARQRA